MDTLFGIKSYIPLKASESLQLNDSFDLMEKTLKFCIDTSNSKVINN